MFIFFIDVILIKTIDTRNYDVLQFFSPWQTLRKTMLAMQQLNSNIVNKTVYTLLYEYRI